MNFFCSALLPLALLVAPAVFLSAFLLIRFIRMNRKPENNVDKRDPTWLISGLLVVAFLGFTTFVIYVLTANRPC